MTARVSGSSVPTTADVLGSGEDGRVTTASSAWFPWGLGVKGRLTSDSAPPSPPDIDDCISSPRTPLCAGRRPALLGSKPLALFPWPRRPASVPNPRSHPCSICACRPLQPLLPLTWLWDPVPAQTLLPAPLRAPDPVRGRHVEPLAPGPPQASL